MKVFRVIKYIFSIAGIGMIAISFLIYNNNLSFLKHAVKAEGTVVDLVKSSSTNIFKPVIQFTNRDGNIIEYVSSSGNNPSRYEIGEKIEILYIPETPQQVRISNSFYLRGFSTVFGIVGCSLVLMSIFCFRDGGKKLWGSPSGALLEDANPVLIAEGLEKIRKRRRFVWIVFFLYIPVALLTHLLSAVLTPYVITSWMILIAFSNLRVSLSRCPLCGERFHSTGGWYNPWTGTCLHCGLLLNRHGNYL